MENFSFQRLRGMPWFYGRMLSLVAIFFLENTHMVYYENEPVLYASIGLEVVAWVLFVVFEILSLRRASLEKVYPDRPGLILWLLFCLIAVLSELSFGKPVRCFFFLLIIPAFLVMNREKGFMHLFLAAAVFSAIPTMLLGAIKFPLIYNSYSLVLAGLGAVLLCAAAMLFFNKRLASPYLYLLLFLLVGCAFLSYVSGGRTGFLTILLCLCLFCLLLLLKLGSIPRAVRKSVPLMLCLLVMVLLAVAVTIYAIYFIIVYFYEDPHVVIPEISMARPGTGTYFNTDDNFLEKLWASANAENLLSNRLMLWRYTLRAPSLLGNGPDFFFDSPLPAVMNSAHNNWLAMYAHYGIPAAIVYFGFSAYMLILAVVNFFRSSRRMSFFPLFIIVSFYVAGMVEDLAYLVPVRQHALLFYAACAYLIAETGSFWRQRRQKRSAG